MTYDKLRKLKPEIKDINQPGGRNDPRFHKRTVTLPAKIVRNTASNMDLLNLYSKGALKSQDIGRVCGQCVNYYPDPALGAHHGRCKAYGYKQVHEELAADVKYNYTEPDGQMTFSEWPGCPEYVTRERLSRR